MKLLKHMGAGFYGWGTMDGVVFQLTTNLMNEVDIYPLIQELPFSFVFAFCLRFMQGCASAKRKCGSVVCEPNSQMHC